MKRANARLLAVLIIVLVCLPVGLMADGARKSGSMEIIAVDPQLTLVLGGGGNSAVFVGADEIILVDSKMGKSAKALHALVMEKAGNRVVTVINTHDHFDHIKGNKLYPEARVIAGAYDPEEWRKGTWGEAYPDTVVEDTLVLDLVEEQVMLVNMGWCHSRNDVVVHFRQRKVLLTGDLVFADRHPVLYGAHTGHWQAALERLLAACAGEEITVVPGHGPVSDIGAIQRMRDYYRDIRGALDDKAQLKILKKRYKGYTSMPGVVSFNRTVKVMRRENQDR